MNAVNKRVADEGVTTNGTTAKPYVREIVWKNAIGFLALHLAAVYGFYLAFTVAMWQSWVFAVFVGVVSAIGIGVGAHRYFSHRCFKVVWPLRLGLVLAHTLAGQNCLYIWVREHRQHHKYSDTNADPHNSTRGFFFSHVGWLMCRKHPDVIEKGKTTDMSDLEADQFVMFQKNYYKTLYILIAMMLPFSVPVYFWGEQWPVAFFGVYLARSVTVLNFTWLVNSAAHLYGTRPYNNKIQPVENPWVSFFSFGEGWHNYHHTFPWDYRASELGQKFGLSTKTIDYCAKKGWIYDMKQAPQSMVTRWAMKFGDGSHPVYGDEYAEIRTTPDKCAVTDLEAFKNIENDYTPTVVDPAIDNEKQPLINSSFASNGNTLKVR